MKLLLSIILSLCLLNINATKYFVSTTGNDDTGNGSINTPYATINKAWSYVSPGDTVYIRGGIYTIPAGQSQGYTATGKNGTAGNLIKLWAYLGEIPVIDCHLMLNGYSGLSGIEFSGNYVYVRGFEIKNIIQPVDGNGHGVYCVAFSITNSNNCIFEKLNIHNNGAIGLNLGNSCTENLILNCDSHHNYDPYTYLGGVSAPGGNADGFHITLTNSTSYNTFRGCRSYWNSDDGYDTFNTEGTVVFDGCWSFWNGYLPGTFTSAGDGMGFKLGQTTGSNDGTYHRIIQKCVSFQNRTHGIDKSDVTQNVKIVNNTIYGNGGAGISLNNTNANYVRNNITLGQTNYFGSNNIMDHNSSNFGATTAANEYLSTDTTGVTRTRNADGSIPYLKFLRLKTTSEYANVGINAGLSFYGSAPELGAFENSYKIMNHNGKPLYYNGKLIIY